MTPEIEAAIDALREAVGWTASAMTTRLQLTDGEVTLYEPRIEAALLTKWQTALRRVRP